jgi:hypothetical protein
MPVCKACGATQEFEGTEAAAPSNIEAEVVLRIPERHFPLMRKTFHDMEAKLGMHGLGELANTLKPYGAFFNKDFDKLRYFNDAALGMVMHGITSGYPASVRITPGNDKLFAASDRGERVKVHVDFTFPDGRVKPMAVADHATPEAAAWFTDYIADLSDRLAPRDVQVVQDQTAENRENDNAEI